MDVGNYVISIPISFGFGLAGLIISYEIFDWLTPGADFATQLNAHNRSIAIFLAGLFIGLGLSLGSAVE